MHTLSRFDEAIASFQKAVALKPSMAEAHNNLGNALTRTNAMTKAGEAYEKAIALQPDYADALYNSAFPLFFRGDFAEGWQRYAGRWKCKNYESPWRGAALPQWRGEDLSGGALLLWGEQGLGEEILYCGMLGDLVARGIPVVLEIAPRLVPLVQRAYPEVRVYGRSDPPHPALADTSIRAQSPLIDLGLHLRPNVASFPRDRHSYLRAHAVRTEGFRKRLTHGGKSRAIGVSWISRTDVIGPHKTTALTDWRPIWEAAGGHSQFVDLQYGDTTPDRATAAAQSLDLVHLDDLDLTRDLDGLAALISACDLVITVSNTTAHLAGALGVPVWVLVPSGHGAMWYWGGPDNEQRWYSSAKIFRQTKMAHWDDVISDIARVLAEAH